MLPLCTSGIFHHKMSFEVRILIPCLGSSPRFATYGIILGNFLCLSKPRFPHLPREEIIICSLQVVVRVKGDNTECGTVSEQSKDLAASRTPGGGGLVAAHPSSQQGPQCLQGDGETQPHRRSPLSYRYPWSTSSLVAGDLYTL